MHKLKFKRCGWKPGCCMRSGIRQRCGIRQIGFTTMEILLVIFSMFLLATIVVQQVNKSSKATKKRVHKQERVNINSSLESFYFKNKAYPQTMTKDGWVSKLGDYTLYFPDGVPASCNQGVGWKVKRGRLSLTGHKHHE